MQIKNPKLLAEYRSKLCDVCNSNYLVSGHHIIHKGFGKQIDLPKNLIPLCIYCHEKVHRSQKAFAAGNEKYRIALEQREFYFCSFRNRWVNDELNEIISD